MSIKMSIWTVLLCLILIFFPHRVNRANHMTTNCSCPEVPVCNEAAAAAACCRKASSAAVSLGALSISWSLLEKSQIAAEERSHLLLKLAVKKT